MKTIFLVLLTVIAGSLSRPADAQGSPEQAARTLPAHEAESKQMEKDLQRLPWPEFRKVIESIPKLRADVEAYGSFGWQFVQSNYQSYGWKKKIDRLDEKQRQALAELIANAHKKIPAMSGSGD